MPVIGEWLAWVMQLPLRAKLIAGGGAGAFVLALIALWFVAGGQRCSSRADVEARVGLVSSALQQAAAQGKIKIADLATGIRRLNAGATAYNVSQDHQTYCDALDRLGDEFRLGE